MIENYVVQQNIVLMVIDNILAQLDFIDHRGLDKLQMIIYEMPDFIQEFYQVKEIREHEKFDKKEDIDQQVLYSQHFDLLVYTIQI